MKRRKDRGCREFDQISHFPHELTAVLDPKAYIGRCPSQVEEFLAKVRPLIEGVSKDSAQINL